MITVEKPSDVFGIGNALVDILVQVDDDFIREHALERGGMTLVDADRQGRLLHALEDRPLEMRSGGSAANTMIAVAQCGGSGFYNGKVARDTHGEFYRQDLIAAGIHFDVNPTDQETGPTGTSLVLVTPDAERTMCTHLGVSTQLDPSDLDLGRLERCKYCYIEGYLWDSDQPRAASLAAMQHARKVGVRVALTYSDLFLVERFADDFLRVTRQWCDMVFCNALELRGFFDCQSLDDACLRLSRLVPLAFVTHGADGCCVVHEGRVEHVSGFPVKPLDTVGAGDAFAGGVLYALSHGYAPRQAARWGNYLASKVVQIHGARLKHPPSDEERRSVLEG